MTDAQRSLRFFYLYLRRYKWRFAIVMVAIVVSTVFQVLAPVYMGRALTALAQTIGQVTQGGHGFSQFHHFLFLMAVFFLLSIAGVFVSSIVVAYITSYSTDRMRRGLFGKLQQMTIRFFDAHQDGDILSRFTSDLDNISNALNEALGQIMSNLVMVVGIIIVMFTQNATMGWLTLSTTPVAILMAAFLIRQTRKYTDRQQDAVGVLNGYINEQITGQKIIITNGLQAQSIAGLQPLNQRVKQESTSAQAYSGMLFPLMQGMSLVNTAVVIFFGSWYTLQSGMSHAAALGVIVIFVQFSQQLYQPITQISTLYSMSQLAVTGARRLNELFDEPNEVNPINGKQLPAGPTGVQLREVHFSYQPGHEILHGVSLDVAPGEMVALVGPTGSGKTTVMNLLNRFYDVDAGYILIGGQEVRDLDLTNLRNHVGIVLQESVLFSRSIADNIKYGDPTASDEQMVAAAKQANIHDFIMSLPETYATTVTNENAVFSTGQKQLVSIARTILTDPSLLILDEATSNVDTVTEARIQQAMDTVIQGRTSFVIAHRLKTILNANKIVVLKDGQVIESGTHEALLAENGFYAELYRNQFVFD